MKLFRYRPATSIVGPRAELENQSIWMSRSDKLNDPMEGFKDVVWSGDNVLWTNLIDHFLLCLTVSIVEIQIGSDRNRVDGRLTIADLETSNVRDLIVEIQRRVHALALVRKIVKFVSRSACQVRRDELWSHLFLVHFLSLTIISQVMHEKGLSGVRIKFEKRLQRKLINMLELFEKHSSTLGDQHWEMVAWLNKEMRLIHVLNMTDEQAREARAWITYEFVDSYLDAIVEGLIHPRWFTACFSSSCTNASMWSSYADEHRGVALVFELKENEHGQLVLPTTGPSGLTSVGGKSSISRSRRNRDVRQVSYSSDAMRIDFFRSIGQLPHQKVLDTWLCNSDGKMAGCLTDLFADESAWRAKIWESNIGCATTKLPDWTHEQEYRMIAFDMLSMHQDAAGFVETFEFDALEGIVFGLRTSSEVRRKITSVVESKCRASGRSDFSFYEATYSSVSKSIVANKLSLLKFKL